MKKALLTTIGFSILLTALNAANGIRPVGADGKPLNLDFETGTLQDWRAEGAAFDKQPVHGDTVVKRRQEATSRHTGDYWVGTYEFFGDVPQGKLTSAPFKVTQPYASFLLGGGSHEGTRVEIVRADTKAVAFKTSANDTEAMRHVVVDLHDVLGQEVFIRLVDEESGGWGHINFDDFKLYAERPKFPDELKPRNFAPGSERRFRT